MLTPAIRRLSPFLALALVATTALLAACGMAPPSMGYQGVLTNSEGTPVPDGNYSMEFRLWQIDYNAGTPEPVQVFTQTSTVSVEDGAFEVALGSQDNRIPVDKMGHEMQLEIVVNGETLTPRQPLYGAPYAFGLYPGAVIYDAALQSNPALSIEKVAPADTPLPALSLQGSLQSVETSYLWVPGSTGHEWGNETTWYMTRVFYTGGGVSLTRSAAGQSYFVIPLCLPGTLFGQAVTLDSVSIYYNSYGDKCGTGATDTRIVETAVRRADTPAGGTALKEDTTARASTDANGSSYTLADIGYSIGGDVPGVVAVYLTVYFGDSNDQIRFQGVRVGLKHE